MSDTIELLEIIGRDASLRHASAEELAELLKQSHASDALKEAVLSGDSMRLSKEFGHKPMVPPQISQVPGHEGDDPDHDEGHEPPRHPPHPHPEKPSPKR